MNFLSMAERGRQAFGAYRAVVSDSPGAVQTAAWTEVLETLITFETAKGFETSAEVLVAAATKLE